MKQDYNNMSEEEQLGVVSKDGYAIEYIENPSEKIQLAAVTENGFAIRFIKNPLDLSKIHQRRFN